VAVAAAWGALYDLGRWIVEFIHNPIHGDFRIFYVAAEAGIRHGWSTIYDTDTLRSLSASFPAGETYINSSATYVSAPLLAWVIAPLTVFPLPVAYAVWTVLSLGALVWAWRVAAPGRGLAKLSLLLLALALWPVMDALYYGQPTLIVIALAAASWWFCTQDRALAAGVALGIATALKPQAVILVPVALLVSGRYRPFAAWAGAVVVLAGLSAIVLGAAGLSSWAQAAQYVQSDGGHSFFTFARIVGAGPVAYVVEGLLGLVALAIARRRRNELDVVFCAGLVGSLASAFHLHQPDYSSLVLAAWLLLRTAPPRWHRAWLVAGIATMQLISLGQPIPQLLWDAGWLVILIVSSYGGSVESAPAIRSAGASAAREGT
jgi:Glycosyltransferase family 87